MNFKLIALNIKQFCPGLSIPVIKQRINVRYKELVEKEDWVFLNNSEVVTLPERVSNGSTESCTVTYGSDGITGVGTTWGAGLVGKMFRFGDDPQFYRIGTRNSNTSLLLENIYGGAGAGSGLDFEYWDETYAPVSNEIGKITGIVYQNRLQEKSREFIQRLDPERSSTGSPVYYSVVDRASQGGATEFDVWPVPDDNYGVRVYYKKTVDELSANADEPVFDSGLIEAGALWDCYRLTFGLTQNPAFMGLARDAAVEYRSMLRDTIIEDMESSSMPGRVRDVMHEGTGIYNDEFMLNRGMG